MNPDRESQKTWHKLPAKQRPGGYDSNVDTLMLKSANDQNVLFCKRRVRMYTLSFPRILLFIDVEGI